MSDILVNSLKEKALECHQELESHLVKALSVVKDERYPQKLLRKMIPMNCLIN